MHRSPPLPRNHGFSLVELAVVLVIVTLLTSGLLLGISAQRNATENVDARHQLENIREALLGFAMANGRLPCPADPASTAGNEQCNLDPNNIPTRTLGVIPWATLSLPETDPWGRRFTYFANASFTAPLKPGALASFTLSTVGNANIKDSASSGSNIASNLSAVIVSHGSNGIGTASDEVENSNSTLTFVSRTPSNDFDDHVIWIVPSILNARMVAAGRLP